MPEKITVTVSKLEPADFCTFQSAIDWVPDPVLHHYLIKGLDAETYDEDLVIAKTIADGSITLQGFYNGFTRTRLINTRAGTILTTYAHRVTSYGMWYDLRPCNKGTGIWVAPSYNYFNAIGNYFTAGCPENTAIGIDLAGSNDQWLIYNNLFRGFAADAQVVVR